MNAYAQILRAPWHRNGGEREVLTSFLSITLVALPMLLLFVGLAVKPHIGFMLAVPCISAGLIIVWGVQFSSLLAQNQPHVARLVPGQLRRLRASAAGLWLAQTIGQATLLGLTFGHPLAWGWGVGIASLAIACMTYWPALLAFVSAPFICLTLWFQRAIFSGLQQLYTPNLLADALSLTTVALALFGLLAGVGFLLLMLKSGGSRHFESYQRRKLWRRSQQTGDISFTEIAVSRSPGSWLGRSYDALYLAWFQRVLRTSNPGDHNALARLELALGPRAHWTSSIYSCVAAAAVLFCTFALLKLRYVFRPSPFNEGYSVSFVVVAFTLAGNFILGLSAQLRRTRHEQALLMLAPGVPQGAALNRGLARRYMARWGVVWLVVCALVALNVHLGSFSSLTRDALFICCIALMPAGFLAWRDWSGATTDSASNLGLFTTRLLLTVAAVTTLVAITLGRFIWHWPVAPLLAGMLAFDLALGIYLWQRLGEFPQALPAGRRTGTPPATQF